MRTRVRSRSNSSATGHPFDSINGCLTKAELIDG
jgi:hypothetical protein